MFLSRGQTVGIGMKGVVRMELDRKFRIGFKFTNS